MSGWLLLWCTPSLENLWNIIYIYVNCIRGKRWERARFLSGFNITFPRCMEELSREIFDRNCCWIKFGKRNNRWIKRKKKKKLDRHRKNALEFVLLVTHCHEDLGKATLPRLRKSPLETLMEMMTLNEYRRFAALIYGGTVNFGL